MKNKQEASLETSKRSSLSLCKDTRGLSSVEYLILLVVIAVGSIAIWQKIGTQVSKRANDSSVKLGNMKAESAASTGAE